MVDGIKTAVDHIRDRWPGAIDIMPHSQIKPTLCPGDSLRTLIANGDLDPGNDTGKVVFDFLERGSRGTRVARLQQAVGATPDGAFGPRTEERVKKVQGTLYPFGGPVSGRVGPELWSYVLWTEGIEVTVNPSVFS